MSHQSDKVLLTSAQAGQLLGKSARTVVRMAESGDLEVEYKLPGPNGAYLFDPATVQEKALQQVQDTARERQAGTLFEADQAEVGERS